VLEHQWLEDGGYLGRPWAVFYNGTNTEIVANGATLDDLMDAECTIEAWVRSDDYGGWLFHKGVNAGVGWRVNITDTNGLEAWVQCATTDAAALSGLDEFTADGKWHHVTIYFNDAGDRKIYLAIDGKWVSSYTTQTAGVGAIVSDAGDDLNIGSRNDTPRSYEGAIGWCALSDNDRYSHGTDFIHPRQPPAPDVNHIEMWHLDEGTGATANAEVTSPGNDGTISNGTWEAQWDIETTPIVPYSVELPVAGWIDFGSAAAIDDLASSTMTIELWLRKPPGGNGGHIIGKNSAINTGWHLSQLAATDRPLFNIERATTDSTVRFAAGTKIADDKWHHLAITWDFGASDGDAWLDGILSPGATTPGAGAYQSDAAGNLVIGALAYFKSAEQWDGTIAWGRISNNIRYTDTFTPPSRLNPPATDANTVCQWNFRDGVGATVLDATANNIDGTITNGEWNITPDMEIDSPGERIFNWGYTVGNDAVDEGIIETLSGLSAGQNYVVRAVAHVESASRGRPKIIIYDETNGAQITALEGPSCHGNHDGLANSATLTDTTARFPQMLVGWTIYNITDGSSATITAISGDMQTITGVLAGGTDNDWDISDEYRIVPPGGPSEYDDYPWIETFTFELPTIARNGTVADCVSISVKMVNGVNEGVIKWHQVELLENLVDNPSLETGAGNPWIPDGWMNSSLVAGEGSQDLVDFHSGSGSIDINAGNYEGIYQDFTTSSGKFYCLGLWLLTTSGGARVQSGSGLRLHSVSGAWERFYNPTKWEHIHYVVREISGGTKRAFNILQGASQCNFDDNYAFELDDVSLTVTPASEANSAESGGLRVDGFDNCTQPIPVGFLTPTSGYIKWKFRSRHNWADSALFGEPTPTIGRFRLDGTRDILVYYVGGNLRLSFNDGGGNHQADWIGATLNSDTEYLFELKYNASQMEIKIDGVQRIVIVTPINFTGIPNIAYWGTRHNQTWQIDAVFIAP
jgi:hypothetical protein